MFAFAPRTKIVFNLALIAVVLFNAWIPSTVAALTPASKQIDSVIATQGSKGLKVKPLNLVRSALQGDVTPTAVPTDTETLTPEPVVTLTPTLASTPTPAPSDVSVLIQAPDLTLEATGLSAEFSVTPNTAKVGDQVTFTITITNNGKNSVTGLHFSNILPEAFNFITAENKNFVYDLKTRELTWLAEKGQEVSALGKMELTYVVEIVGSMDGAQLTDKASLTADGLTDPISLETTLTLSNTENSITLLDAKGGQAVGLDGQVRIAFPVNSLDAAGAISIRQLEKGTTTTDGKPWLQFELGLNKLREETISQENDKVVFLEPVEAKFTQPVNLTVSFDGLTDLATLGADQTPFLATLDEASLTWVRMPLTSIDRETNTISAALPHFSTWGVGIGPAFSGGNALLFDNAYSSLFTGGAHYSIPIWTPPGRNGMQPNLALSYSSSTADGILGDVQAPWVGMGWNVDSVEVARKITTTSGGYGYENKFLLLFNGTGYELILDGTTPGRYHTKSESFLYIQLHSNNLGNNSPTATNLTSEWWEVVQRDGTRWRLGWTTGSEQLAAMKGYPGAATGAWAALGYAGSATNVVTARWRADLVSDVYGNQMTLSYTEETRLVAGTSSNYDRASYISLIQFTKHNTGSPGHGYAIVFVTESRGANDVPATPTDWENWDSYRLNIIQVWYASTIVRTYDLDYVVSSYSDDGKSWQTTKLTSVATAGGGINAPTITFTYTDKDNRASCAGCQEWAYPRLATVANGWGSTATYTYGNDGRPSTSWYNWRITTLDIADGVNANPMKTTYAYSTPCYNDLTAGWCNASNIGGLIGYGQTTATTKEFNGTTTLAIAVHKFYTDEQKAGREYEAQYQDASGVILSQTNTAYTVVTAGLPAGGYFTFANAVEQYLQTGTLTRVSKTEYDYNTTTGNLNWVKEKDGALALYRETAYDYLTNTATPASYWILNTLWQVTLKDAVGTIISRQQYGYNGNLPGVGVPTTNKPDLSRVVNGTQTIDTKYHYDSYGNMDATYLYKTYGTTTTLPSGTPITYSIGYDTLKTYVTSTTPPLLPATTVGYDYGLGLPTTIADPNGNTTTNTYDGLGRILSVKYPGYTQANVMYTYSSPTLTKIDIWDETASVYRSAWQKTDGLGRVIQTQSPYETSGYLVLSDISYNAQGLASYQGLPRTLSGTGGGNFAPTWGSLPHTTASYDALGRLTSVLYADGNSDDFTYSGLQTTLIDRNDHQKMQEVDAFGRLIKVKEYTGSYPAATLYATTTYTYNERNLLKQVTDAAGNPTLLTYDGFGRKIEMTDPDMGNWRYRYDTLGRLTAQVDAKRQAINMYYDDLNRLKGKTYTTGPVNPDTYQPPADPGDTVYTVKYYYDAGTNGKGHRTSMVDPSGSTTWVYNALGQATNATQNVDSANYAISGTFDAFGRPLTQTLPSTEALTYSYNAMGALSGLSGTSTYVSQIHYAPSGQVTDLLLGNGLLQQSCYNANTLRLTGLRVYSGTLQTCGTAPASPRLNLSYAYQPNGNVSQIVDGTRNETLTYTYDELDRLKTISGPYSQSYNYNAIGNIIDTSRTSQLTKVVTGEYHTCAMTTNNGDKCWGSNFDGELGDGTTTQKTTPVDVSGLTSGLTTVVANFGHSCALTASGGVKCWGYNGQGQLGDGTWTSRSTPVNVSGLTSGVVAVSAGKYHTCALTAVGGVKCWGDNDYGELGDGTVTQRTTPVNVSGLSSGVIAIATGDEFTCALLTGGGVKCWGQNTYGELGDGTTTQRNTPVDVIGLSSGVVKIAAGGGHACAITTSGGVKCWGWNGTGTLGDGTYTNRYTPVDVSGLTSGVVEVSGGEEHTCALTSGGAMKCWGWNSYGQVGDGTTYTRNTPVNVSGLTGGVLAIEAGWYHSCAITTSGEAKCWGLNNYGQLGNGTLTDSLTPLNTTLTSAATYTFGDSAHKHAVTSLSTGETYTYDANGNMTCRVEGGITYKQEYNFENLLTAVKKMNGTCASGTVLETTSFMYDGDGNMVKKTKPDGSKTIYMGGVYEVDKTSGGTVTRTVTYYPAGGAMRINISGGSNTVYYLLKDHLGSASVVTDASGNTVGEQRYYAYGETRLSTGSIYTDKLYTGQREMAGLGIYHYNARFYSPKLGRFLSADTIVPNPYNPQDLNRFSYVRNNPIRYTDPTGHMVACEPGDVCDRMPLKPAPPPRVPAPPPPCSSSICNPNGGGGGGGGGNGGNSGGSDECNEGHCYDTDNIICAAELNCTAEQIQEYALMFQYPGQLPWQPVQNGGSYIVFPSNIPPWVFVQIPVYGPLVGPLMVATHPLWEPLGAIDVAISNNGLTLTNVSQPTHIFHVGDVVRSYYQDENGAWHVSTVGTGTNDTPFFGPFIDSVNGSIGDDIFDIVDNLMAEYILLDKSLP